MLLIGDIHITARYKEQILMNIKSFVEQNNDEQNIIFLGDYVYHFSYHRSSLLDLFGYFLELISQGKNIFVLAGNHDRLGQHFVFSEAEKLLNIIDLSKFGKGKLHLITKPEFHNIEGKDILFFPFTLLSPSQSPSDLSLNPPPERRERSEPTIFNSIQQEIYLNAQQLLDSENKNEQQSGQLNIFLLNLIKKHQKKGFLNIIHHHYIANTVFPGQRARFSYKDIALDPRFLDMENIKMIAGHLHQSFVHKNFICAGSVWHTSPTEYNHYKVFLKRDTNIMAIFTHLNPYLIVEDQQESVFGKGELQDFLQTIMNKTKKNLSDMSGSLNLTWKVDFGNEVLPQLSNCNLIFKTKKSYQEIDEIISSDLQKDIKDVKLKIPTGNIQDLAEKLDTTGKSLGTSLSDWQDLLKAHITNRYQDKSERYFEIMRELKLM